MTRHRKDIKRLSTAIARGYAIAKENGIKRSIGVMFRHTKTGKLTHACALGMAVLGVEGIDGEHVDLSPQYTLPKYLREKLNADESVGREIRKKYPKLKVYAYESVVNAAMLLNDAYEMPIPKIVEILKSVGN